MRAVKIAISMNKSPDEVRKWKSRDLDLIELYYEKLQKEIPKGGD